MNILTAAVQSGKVIDVEQMDAANPPGPRLDGLPRVDCHHWVFPGCKYADGQWLMPNSSAPPDDITRRPPWSSREFYLRVEAYSPGAWDRLDAAATSDQTPTEYRAIFRSAIRQSDKATEVVAQNQDTIDFVSLAVGFGVITAQQADGILRGL